MYIILRHDAALTKLENVYRNYTAYNSDNKVMFL